jgi:hypothetical protein
MSAAPQLVTLGDHALQYASYGFAVFPVSPVDKAPLNTHGMLEGTTDLDVVRAWWTKYPDALIGARIPADMVVLDIDPRHGGDAVWQKLTDDNGGIVTGRKHHSGRGDGGAHIWFNKPPGKLSVKRLNEWARSHGLGHATGKNGWSAGIDLLHHDHRYTILPPSPHPATNLPYEWDAKGKPVDMPAWLVPFTTATAAPAPTVKPLRIADENSIADWYSSAASWNDILGDAGWVRVNGDGDSDGSTWRHPNATSSQSSTIKHGCLFVYSPNTDFEVTEHSDPKGYTRFKAWTLLEHDGDGSAAARAAREMRDGPNMVYATITTYEAAKPGDEWPEAIPLGETESVAKFPVEVLPGWMQPIVTAIADDLQAEPDLPGVLGLVALSVACASRREVLVRGTWREPLNIYCAVALPPSSGKSPAFKHMMAPIRAYEKAEMEAAAGQVEHVAQTRRMIEKAMKRAEDKGDAQEARIQLDKLLNTPEAHPFRLVLDDATPEALIQKLYEHNQRLSILSTEGGPFEMMGGRYSENANLDPYLKPWSNDPISVDRIGRATTILDRPMLTIGLTVQPAVIARLADNPALIGKGLTTRFMYSVPITRTGHRDMHYEGNVPQEVRDDYAKHIVGLLRASLSDRTDDITVDADAVLEYHGWRQGLENMRGEGAPLHQITEWTTKLESTVVRVAALLALADGVDVVDVATMRRAIALGNYWLSHIRAVLDLWGRDDTITKARQVLAWARHRELDDFSVRDLYGSLRRLFPVADDTRPVLNLLTERGWIRPMFDGPLVLGRRGVDSPRFAVRPLSLWISGPHARHARHVLKQGLTENSLTSPETERGTPHAHDAHGAHEVSEPPMGEQAPPTPTPPLSVAADNTTVIDGKVAPLW